MLFEFLLESSYLADSLLELEDFGFEELGCGLTCLLECRDLLYFLLQLLLEPFTLILFLSQLLHLYYLFAL